MEKQPIEIFQENYYEILNDLKRNRQQGTPAGTSSDSASIAVSEEQCKTAVVEELYKHTKTLVREAKRENAECVKEEARTLIHGSLDYLEVWGSNAPVTAQERKAHPEDGTTVAHSQPIARLEELFEDKGDDYEMDEVTYLSYCIMGHWSIIHEVHKKAQRLYSVTVDEDPNFEEAEDTVFDLCNYALFLLAYLALPGDLSYDWVIYDIQ